MRFSRLSRTSHDHLCIQFAPLPKNRNGMMARYIGHPFGNLCRGCEIEHSIRGPTAPFLAFVSKHLPASGPEPSRTHGEALSLSGPRSAPKASRRFRRCLQLRTKAQDPQRPHTLRAHLQTLDVRARKMQPWSAPSDAGTEHLICLGVAMSGPIIDPGQDR